MTLENRIKSIKSEIASAKLVVVTKKQPIDKIKLAIRSGAKIIGENRVGEAQEKYEKLKDFLNENNVEFHFIGHLQRNKVKYAVPIFNMIQSLDSLRLAKKINKEAKKIEKIQEVLVQINIAREPQKYGITPEKAIEFVNKVKKFENLNIKGLMCMAPYVEAEKTRPYFREMKKLFNKADLEILSMGMTNDYKIAVEEGSNMVRIGRGIFGE